MISAYIAGAAVTYIIMAGLLDNYPASSFTAAALWPLLWPTVLSLYVLSAAISFREVRRRRREAK